jgi:hypothetical protein
MKINSYFKKDEKSEKSIVIWGLWLIKNKLLEY